MLRARKPLVEMTADNVMSRHLVTVPENMTLRAAARRLSQANISGAPVVNEKGCCTGVLSATDFLRWAGTSPCPSLSLDPEAAFLTKWGLVNLERVPLDEVRAYMTGDVVTVAPADCLGKLARMMIDAHIHRVVVIDERQRPVGIVTSTDILAALAHASIEDQ